ncbi:hypothetical protein [Ammoniphilus sp. YIM 78166]|uniref:hypothetical protein n=1 Tax=Ammoniphilus sp. YIM 78166 TaxID=1644106 RepID=UPI00106F4F68|nr:hypothetical protein [Ammoniphilus sp. YIM 78166]
MNKKYYFVLGLILAIAIGTFLPRLFVGDVMGSSDEETYQLVNLGMTSDETRNQIHEILDGIVGISSIQIDPLADLVTITVDTETMKPEWIMKSLNAHGFSPEEYHKVK